MEREKMIKELKERPKEIKPKAQADRIKEDIEEAWDNGYEYFEFAPDGYNIKYLGAYANAQATDMIRQMIKEEARSYIKERGYHVHYSCGYPRYKDKRVPIIKIHSVKAGESLKVYGEIHKDRYDERLDEIFKEIDESEEKWKREHAAYTTIPTGEI